MKKSNKFSSKFLKILTIPLSLALLLSALAVPAYSEQADSPATTFTQESDGRLLDPPQAGSEEPGASLGQGIEPLAQTSSLNMQASAVSPTGSGVLGMDVSGWQTTVDWAAEYARGARFAYVKATEGKSYKSARFASQYAGAGGVGMKRGAYHFALPSVSSGADQARFFVASGGGWTADGLTLPGLLDIEYNPYSSLGDSCFNMSAGQINDWISSFITTYRSLTGRYPAIYTASSWWAQCTGNTSQFNFLPLHIARYAASPGTLPAGYATYDMWQYSASGPFAGDSNVFNGSLAALDNFALNPSYRPLGGVNDAGPVTVNGFTLKGAIKARYFAGGGSEKCGFPTSNEFALRLNGVAQIFSNSCTIYWTAQTGAHIVSWKGDIGAKFAQAGYEAGWGYPLTEELTFWHGAKQHFRNADASTVAYWSAATGTHTLNGRGAIFARWARDGDVKTYGFPISDERRMPDSSYRVDFENGTSINWSAARGTWVSSSSTS